MFDTNQINSNLYRIYKSSLDRLLAELPLDSRLSYPQFIEVPLSYVKSSFRLMIVGQQANRWTNDKYLGHWQESDVVKKLMDQYSDFDCGRNYQGTPLFSGVRKIASILSPEIEPNWFIWSNLVKIDAYLSTNSRGNENGIRVQPEIEDVVCRHKLLEQEIQLLQPNIVIFLTGPDYQERLRKTFPSAQFDPLSPTQPWSLVSADGLPLQSYLTYHPGYLRRSRLERVYHEITNAILSSVGPTQNHTTNEIL